MKMKTFFLSVANASLEDVVRSIATLGTLGAVLYLYIVGRPVPGELYTLLGVFIGYFFGRVATLGTGQVGQGLAINGAGQAAKDQPTTSVQTTTTTKTKTEG